MKASTSSHDNLPTVPQVELQRSASASRIPIIPVSPKPNKKRQALGQNAFDMWKPRGDVTWEASKSEPPISYVPRGGRMLLSGDDFNVPKETLVAVTNYFDAIAAVDSSSVSSLQEFPAWIEAVRAMSQSRMSPQVKDYFGRLIAEWAQLYLHGQKRATVNYHMLAESAPGNQRDVDFDMRSLQGFPEYWISDENRSRAWKVLRWTGVSSVSVASAANAIIAYYAGDIFSSSLSIERLWIDKTQGVNRNSGNGLLVNMGNLGPALPLPATLKSFHEVLVHQVAKTRDNLRKGWGDDISKLLQDVLQTAGQRENGLRLTRQVLKRSILQMTRQLRQMGESTIAGLRDLIVSRHTHGKEEPVPEKESNRIVFAPRRQTGKSAERSSMFHGGDWCTRKDVLIAALRHASGTQHFNESVQQHLHVRKPLLKVELIINDEGKVSLTPSLETVVGIIHASIDQLVETTNSLIDDSITMHASSDDPVEAKSAGAKDDSGIRAFEHDHTHGYHAFTIMDDDDGVAEIKRAISECLAARFDVISTVIQHLRPFEDLFDNRHEEEIDALIESFQEMPVSEQIEASARILLRYNRKMDCASQSLTDIVDFDLFSVLAIPGKNAVRERCEHLKSKLMSSMAARNRERMKSTCTEYAAIAERLVRVPEDSDELRELQAYFAEIQQRIGELASCVTTDISTVVKFLTLENKFPLSKQDMTLFSTSFAWPREIDSVQDRSINIQNAEKIKREEILQARRTLFEKELNTIKRDVGRLPTYLSLMPAEVSKTCKTVKQVEASIEDALAESAAIAEQEELLQVEGDGGEEYNLRIEGFKETVKPFSKLWNTIEEKIISFEKWYCTPLIQLNAEVVENDADNLRREMLKIARQFGQKEGQEEVTQLATTVTEECADFIKSYVPLLTLLCTRGMKQRHWDAINKTTGKNIRYDPDNANLRTMVSNHKLHLEVAAIEDTCINASKEFSLESAMNKMDKEWEGIEFGTKVYKETGTSILTSCEEIETILDDQIVRAQAMKGSRYIGPFVDRINKMERILKILEELIENWQKCQGTWLYLEPIFSSEDIQKQMPTEAKRFATVDRTWRDVMKDTVDEPGVIATAERDGILDRLKQANNLLELIQKGLKDYLNTKRVFFPRFFFLSNDELLEILSETKDPLRVQPHLKKCFEGISALEFDKDLTIRAMISSEKEKVAFHYEDLGEKPINPNDAGGCVEIWLDQIQNIMRKEVALQYDLTMKSYAEYEARAERTQWIPLWPGQLVLGVSQTYWTQETTAALARVAKGESDALQKYTDQLSDYIKDIIQMVRGEVPKIVRKTISPLCVLDVHSRDTCQMLVDTGISSPDDFDWLSQLRYYWKDDGESMRTAKPGSVECKMINAVRLYAYEYLGNSMRLVITPLTDRCYRTLMGAIHLDYGGAPAGPAGTGKTETVKDLGKAIAIQCVVYNCSDSLDFLAMAKFFKGLAGTGAWACFDEFNRINLDVLSVVAQQILTITIAKQKKLERFDFEGENIMLRLTCCVFVTMNPGYAGRQELPDNLKALFRSVAMMVPDYAMIGQIILYSMGYLDGLALARKIVMTYKLCSEQLSNQRHYDYGMRAVVAVLRASGALKRKFPEENEAILCLRSIIDVNLPKFLAPDVPLFEGIVSDLFPGVELPTVERGIMDEVLRETIKANGLQQTEYFMGKVYQIYEMMLVRHGFMVVGWPYAGKTNALKILAETMTALHERYPDDSKWKKVYHTIINPKSITMGQLYGQFDPVTHEWTDGVLAISYRNFAASPPKIGNQEDLKWVWFDGPVDAIWIENMNTVLDDNKKLCLMSGEMVMMSDTMSMIFEPMDLEVASPATVSRVGVVYMEPHRLGWRPCLASWIDRLSVLPKDPEAASEEPPLPQGMKWQWCITPEEAKAIEDLINWLFEPCRCFVQRMCHTQASTLDQTDVMSALRLVEAQMDSLLRPSTDAQRKKNKNKEGSSAGKKKSLTQSQLEGVIIYSIIWSVGAVVDAEGRQKFSDFLCGHLSDPAYVMDPDLKDVQTQLQLRSWKSPFGDKAHKLSHKMPTKGSVFDSRYVVASDSWKPWLDKQSTFEIPEGAMFNSILVPNIVTAQLSDILSYSVLAGHPSIVMGPTGTGKSVFVKQLITKNLDQEKFKPIQIMFTATTTANETQEIADAALDKRRKGVFGPPFGTRAIVFVDDLSLPETEEYGAQPPIELLRQMVDNGGWYDIREKTWRQLVDTQLICTMAPPGGSNQNITPRMMRHFSIICVDSFDNEALTAIYMSIMSWHVKSTSMPEGQRLGKAIIAGSIELYNKAKGHLLPTPKKSHYTFNLRDLSRIVQGILLLRPPKDTSNFAPGKVLPKLWIHECTRVISDRLLDETDQMWMVEAISEVLKAHFKVSFDDLLSDLRTEDINSEGSDPVQASYQCLRRLFFGNWLKPNVAKRDYMELEDVDGLVGLCESYLESYNAENKTGMDLVMFVFAVEHVSRIARVLSMPGGNMLLVGVGGSGRQSLTRLAAFMLEYNIKQIELSKNYGLTEWYDDLKYVIKAAGTGEKPIVFLFTDSQVKYESFVLDINSMLNTGQVPNIFAIDEKMEILDAMRTLAKKLPGGGKDMSSNDLWAFFQSRGKDNLHVVLAFSPIGNAFRTRLRKFPSLVNCTTIDWFYSWPIDALEAVAVRFLKDIKLEDNVRQALIPTCGYLHSSTRELAGKYSRELKRVTYTTPTSYLELIRAFQGSLDMCREKVQMQRDRYSNGLEQLAAAAQTVEVMQQELQDLLPGLAESQKQTAALMETIEEKLPGVQAMEKKVGDEAAVVQVTADECAAMKKECEDDLAEAIPLLEGAIKALNTLKPSDITEVKAMKTPPAGVVLVMSSVCDFLGVKPDRIKDPENDAKKINDYWGPSKKHLLGDSKFIQRLKDYDKDNIPQKVVDKIRRKYIPDPNFEPEKVKKASLAAMGLCKWVRAMEAYDRVAKVVAPKKAKLRESEEELAVTMEQLNAKKDALKKVQDDLAELNQNLADAEKRKDDLEANVKLCNEKLVRATELIDGLGGEQARWSENVKQLSQEFTQLTGNVLISAGLMAYLGPFTASYREEIIKKWVSVCKERAIPCSEEPSLMRTLGDPVKVRQWQVEGLPTDNISVDNAIIVFNSRRWPLFIDPQGQANNWIRNMEADSKLKVVKLTDATYMRTIENAVQFGSPVLLENVPEVLDPTLEPLLQKATFKQGGVTCIRLGDNTVEYSEHFRFYITTKLRNPHYLPETAVKVTLLNFMITPAGLTDQLLAMVVQEERADLAEEKVRLIVEGANNAKALKACEDEILHILSSSEGNILENAEAIDALKNSKKISDEIKKKQLIAAETEKEIDAVRNGYVPVATRGQVLYFCISDLASLEPTYQYSLEWFINLFVRGIRDSEPSRDLETRLDNLSSFFTYSLYCNICRSLLEKDKLLFSFLLAIRQLQNKGKVLYAEWYFLLTGGVVTENPHKNPAKSWLSDKAWGEICRLAELSAFQGLRHAFTGEASKWKSIYDAQDAHEVPLPGAWNEKLGSLQKMLVLRCLRPDKIVPAVQNFVMEFAGDKFVKPPPFNLQLSYDESNPVQPLVFVLSAGSDPMNSLLKFGDSVKQTINSISLGQGQGVKAEAMMVAGKKDGSWVVLQNAHLYTKWMPELERLCEQTKLADCHPKYRLWITTYPSDVFPVSVLQNSVKMTVEPPRGMRANLLGSYTNDPINDPDFFGSVEKAVVWRRLLYSLCFFHADVQERREFGALGWNNPYEFNESDLRISVKQLAMFLDLYDELPFKALNYCFGQCNYGGRVTDDKDRRCLVSILQTYFRPEVLAEDYNITPSGTYKMPADGRWEHFVTFIEGLPLSSAPEIFGLHINANITKDQNSTNAMFASILETEGGGGGGDEGGKSQEDVIFEVAQTNLSKIPSLFDMELAKLKYPVRWDNSMNTVLCQELQRFNSLSNVITSSLKDVMDAVKGVIVMSKELEAVGTALFFGRVAQKWLDASYPSLKPLASYISDFLDRLTFLQKWLDGKAPPAYWISGFYFTQAFLTGTLQNFARRHTVEIDNVDFDFEIMVKQANVYRKPPADGAYVYGLFIDGARWDMETKLLADSEPKVLFSPAPVIWLNPKPSEKMSKYSFYDCPVYKTSERRGMLSTTGHSTNFVMMVRLPSDREQSAWIKAGVAMITSLDD
eukprot:g1615.t1